MAQMIIGIAGKKTSGKSTLCNMLHGHQLMSYEIIKSFSVDESGKLLAELYTVDEKGREGSQKGELDITRQDEDFSEWATLNVWPFVKHYAFAMPVKEFLINFFDLPRENLYGTDEQKNQLSQYLWEDMPVKVKNKNGNMTYREMMQYFGTNICRKIKDSVWVDFTCETIKLEQSELAIISDVRYPNEAKAIKEMGGIIVKLLKGSESTDSHDSETGVEEVQADLEIDNTNLTPIETYQKVLEYLESNEFLAEHVQYVQKVEKENPRKHVTGMK